VCVSITEIRFGQVPGCVLAQCLFPKRNRARATDEPVAYTPTSQPRRQRPRAAPFCGRGVRCEPTNAHTLITPSPAAASGAVDLISLASVSRMLERASERNFWRKSRRYIFKNNYLWEQEAKRKEISSILRSPSRSESWGGEKLVASSERAPRNNLQFPESVSFCISALAGWDLPRVK
jgi:hypothetical protein